LSRIKPPDLFDRLLTEAETRFGKRARLLHPIIVLPRDNPTPGQNGCFVYYDRNAENEFFRLQFQLAHEAIHVLSGALRRDATKLEEGFAVWFSLHHDQMNRKLRKREESALKPLFAEALKLFIDLGPTDDAISALRTLRPDLDTVEPADLERVFSVSEERALRILDRVPLGMHARLA
jgi:hypothetical protein